MRHSSPNYIDSVRKMGRESKMLSAGKRTCQGDPSSKRASSLNNNIAIGMLILMLLKISKFVKLKVTIPS